MEPNKMWQVSGDCFFLRDRSVDTKKIDKGVYTVEVTPIGELYLKRIEESFEFPYKIYGMETQFIDRAMKSYLNTNGNMGIIANGIKGTGKTVCMKMLANRTDLPVILIHQPFGGLNTFISEIQQDVVIFVDEYEKIYSDGNSYSDDEDQNSISGNSALLSLMDGTYTTKHRRMFLLTTNKLWINENMLNRPGRIRYMKKFSDLNKEQIMEIIDDCLNKKLVHFKDKLIEYLSLCDIITVDIVKSVISEINIHEEDPFLCCKDFNIQFKDEKYSVIRMPSKPKEKEVVLIEDVELVKVNRFINNVKSSPTSGRLEDSGVYLSSIRCKDGIYTVRNNYGSDNIEQFNIRFDKRKTYHSVFSF